MSEIADWKFTPGQISAQLTADYTAEVQPKDKAVARRAVSLCASARSVQRATLLRRAGTIWNVDWTLGSAAHHAARRRVTQHPGNEPSEVR